MRAALAQYARVPAIGQTKAAVFLRDDEAEQPQIAQALNELRRLLGLSVPALEVLLPRSQELVDGMYRDGFFCPMAKMVMGETAGMTLATPAWALPSQKYT